MGILHGKRALVTGASGFIGAHLTKRLVEEKAEVFVLLHQNRRGNLPLILGDLEDGINTCNGDLTDFDSLDSIVGKIKPHKVFHLGGFVDLDRSFDVAARCIDSNIRATLNLLHALRRTSLDSFVHTGTCEVYGDKPVPFKEDQVVKPLSPYAISKFTAELFCEMYRAFHDYPVVRLRLSNVYGPRQHEQRLIPAVILACLRNENVFLSSGKQRRDFNYVDDVVDALVKAATLPQAIGEIINVGNPQQHSVKEIVEKIIEKMRSEAQPIFGALSDRKSEPQDWCCDDTKARRLLKWERQVDLDEGLQRTIDHFVTIFQGAV